MPSNLRIPGWMPEHELNLIEQLAAMIPSNGRMVEVGSFLRRSTCRAADWPTFREQAKLRGHDIKVTVWGEIGSVYGCAARAEQTAEVGAVEAGQVR